MREPAPWVRPLVRRLNRIARERPRLGLRLAAIAGHTLGPRLGDAWTPTLGELEALFGELDPRTAKRLRRAMASHELRNRALMALLRRLGPEPMHRLMRVRGAEGLLGLREAKVPVVVCFWHLGVIRAVEQALVRLGLPLYLAGARVPLGPNPGFRYEVVTDAVSGLRFLKGALKELEQGGVPVVAVDGSAGAQSRRAPFFGRSLPVPPGLAILARSSGARVVPATSRWVGLSAGIEVTLHEPLPEPASSRTARLEWEQELLDGATAWYERHVRAHPEDMRPVTLRMCLSQGVPLSTASPAAPDAETLR